jgi:DNA repair protein RecO (recombination protein O)
MHVRAPAILVAARQHGETAAVARFFTRDYGVVAAYVAGGRGRRLRPVLIPGNLVDLQLAARSESQLPFAKIELLSSRGPWLSEPLPAAAITWVSALTATALPERQPYPPLYQALGGVLDAICHAPAARQWAGALVGYETLLLRELGYGGQDDRRDSAGGLADALAVMDRLADPLDHYLLADRRGDVMAARSRVREMLARIA